MKGHAQVVHVSAALYVRRHTQKKHRVESFLLIILRREKRFAHGLLPPARGSSLEHVLFP